MLPSLDQELFGVGVAAGNHGQPGQDVVSMGAVGKGSQLLRKAGGLDGGTAQ
jgi:hypothetical protein